MRQQVSTPDASRSHGSCDRLTKHARQRCGERGIGFRSLTLVLHYGTPRPSRDGCFAMGLPAPTARKLMEERGVDHGLIKEARSVRAIVSQDGAVVTVMKRRPKPSKWREPEEELVLPARFEMALRERPRPRW